MNNLTLFHKELEKKECLKPQISRRKETIKIKAQINEIETRKTVEKSIKQRVGFFKTLGKLTNF